MVNTNNTNKKKTQKSGKKNSRNISGGANGTNNKEEVSEVNSSEINPKNDKDYRCAPSKKFQDGSCIPLEDLIDMAKAYNEVDTKNPIKLSTTLETLNPRKYKRYLVREFGKKLDKVCDDQRCWLKQRFINKTSNRIKTDLTKNTFRPEGPQGKFDWLNTFNINNVMEQYMTKHKDFKFLGALPLDFDDVETLGIKNLNFNDLVNSGKTKLGMVFNLDKHTESGSHWNAAYADLVGGHVYFFDSYGTNPPPEIRKLLRRIARFIGEYNPNVKPNVDFNRIRHQWGGSECGVFSIYFILRMLEGSNFHEFVKEDFRDEDVNKLRNIIFT